MKAALLLVLFVFVLGAFVDAKQIKTAKKRLVLSTRLTDIECDEACLTEVFGDWDFDLPVTKVKPEKPDLLDDAEDKGLILGAELLQTLSDIHNGKVTVASKVDPPADLPVESKILKGGIRAIYQSMELVFVAEGNVRELFDTNEQAILTASGVDGAGGVNAESALNRWMARLLWVKMKRIQGLRREQQLIAYWDERRAYLLFALKPGHGQKDNALGDHILNQGFKHAKFFGQGTGIMAIQNLCTCPPSIYDSHQLALAQGSAVVDVPDYNSKYFDLAITAWRDLTNFLKADGVKDAPILSRAEAEQLVKLALRNVLTSAIDITSFWRAVNFPTESVNGPTTGAQIYVHGLVAPPDHGRALLGAVARAFMTCVERYDRAVGYFLAELRLYGCTLSEWESIYE